MKHVATIQLEFLNKVARNWDDLTLEEQKGYLQRHPKTKRRLTAKPEHAPEAKIEEKPVETKIPQPVAPAPVAPAVPVVPAVKVPIETKPANSMTKKEIGKLLADHGIGSDSLSYSNKKGGFVFKRGYFYRHGGSPEKLAESIAARTKNIGLTPKIIDTSDNWHAWPKDSWFEAVISFDQMKQPESKPSEWDAVNKANAEIQERQRTEPDR